MMPELQQDAAGACDEEPGEKTESNPLVLYQPQDIDTLIAENSALPDLPHLQTILAWSREFVAQPHEALGRSGDVCPYVRPSMLQGLFYLAVCHLKNPTCQEEIYHIVMRYARLFLQAPVSSEGEEGARLKTYLLIFPDVPLTQAEAVIEPVHKRLKTQLLPQGATLGQFYPGCKIGASWNPRFLALQSPLPMLSIRCLVESDWRFVRGTLAWEEAYRQYFEEATLTREQVR